ncbi:MAG: lytic murein transglycosylase [Methyloligellaceae bacterium]
MAAAFLAPVTGAVTVPTAAAQTAFGNFVEQLWPAARAKGVSRRTFERAFKGVRSDPDVLEKDAHQPEFVKPIWVYLASAVSSKRIETGAKKLKAYRSVLDKIEARYGVDRHVVIAIWGMESNYGSYRGKRYVVRSLATLAHQGRRQSFGRTQLLAALRILQRGDVTPARMTGSWAGAMGHTQFIPTTYNAHAVDFDGDGKRDIWGNIPDALASTANYLRVSKWRKGETWGYEVTLPRRFNYALAGRKRVKTLSEWSKLGVKRVRGRAFPRPDDQASLILPTGARGPAFLVLNNFRSILRYNNATAYALAVGHLSDRIRGFSTFVRPWPKDAKPLARAEREELQRLLTAKGFSTGGADGVLGSRSREAIRAYQRDRGLVADGFPSQKLLQRLRQDAG